MDKKFTDTMQQLFSLVEVVPLLQDRIADLSKEIESLKDQIQTSNKYYVDTNKKLDSRKYSQRQALEYLGISPHYLRKCVEQGLIECSTIGARKQGFSYRDLQKFKYSILPKLKYSRKNKIQ